MSRESRAGALAFLAAWATLFAQVAALSMTAGITAVFLAAVPVYLLAGFAELSSARRS